MKKHGRPIETKKEEMMDAGPQTPPAPPPYYICTTVVGMLHLRLPGPRGLQTKGGTDTPSLCGRVRGGPKVRDLPDPYVDLRSFQERGCAACVEVVKTKGG